MPANSSYGAGLAHLEGERRHEEYTLSAEEVTKDPALGYWAVLDIIVKVVFDQTYGEFFLCDLEVRVRVRESFREFEVSDLRSQGGKDGEHCVAVTPSLVFGRRLSEMSLGEGVQRGLLDLIEAWS